MQRAWFLTLVAWLLAVTPLQTTAAFAQAIAAPPTLPPAPAAAWPDPLAWTGTNGRDLVTTETVVQGAGALIGIVAFNFYVAPLSAASGVGGVTVRSLLGSRVVATTLAATGAVLTTYIYDRWTDQPLDYTYFWSRGGAIVGVGAGTALLAQLGYPPSATYARFSPPWVANRAFLFGSALLGIWGTKAWLRRDEPEPPP